jgi:hypothetical protein
MEKLLTGFYFRAKDMKTRQYFAILLHLLRTE